MKINKIVLLAGLSTLAFSPLSAIAAEPMQPSGVLQAVLSNSEKDFFESAASSNMLEIEAAKLAQTKASRPELKNFAEQMIKDHTEASQKLQALATSKGVTLPTQLLGRHQQMLDALAKDKPGKDFDKDYENKMVLTHKEAVSLFDQTAKEAKDPQVKAFAAELLPKLQQHGAHAKELNT
ncbi:MULTISPECIES: DUF4142 domain-containing protein [Hydrocarboniphaga]|uniref:DUF4142 domain-containing protein n=1 Tax=Hydrocarboniphaga effusa AP103 TaxID=1172194 RepID=I8T197_9GAMM|nr:MULTISPECIES: DUF4142 domain-containing protein [Hydrocarboniphaga]EIT67670.1 hypothetical protein WQQ_41050 [Hydrocarboniphaga effusa AP103]MDZ4080921.1 DUF4142 domain-containing protein [Hydrocarboniphaga sp.]